MEKFAKKLKLTVKLIMGYLPAKLPTTVAGFEDFSLSILSDYDLPDMPSYRHAIATMIMHLPPTMAYKSKRYFALSIRKAMANQVAYDQIQKYKDRSDERNTTETNTNAEPVSDSELQGTATEVVQTA